jgi:hypothetical protein
MFDAAQQGRWTLASVIEPSLRRLEQRVQRARRAWRYCVGGLSAADAQEVIRDCRCPAGWHPLMMLAVDDVLNAARAIFADHPDLPWLTAEACIHVERRWCPSGDDLEQAQSWAVELVQRYAAADGIVLERTGIDHQ